MLEKIDHIGVAVPSIEEVKRLYREVFGLEPAFEEEVPDQKVRVVGFRIGESNIEYLEPTGEDSPIARFLEKRGAGLHHVAVTVENIGEALARLKRAEVPLIDQAPRRGAEGKWIAFVHPKGFHGVLLELSQAEESS
ncbi:MAG: methylmalonyl-CoA epimerase [Calditrichaeota bacterium]|nr:MAG: methylmalonyl-CoA epimerase [Calditrichota bacterium]